MNHQILLARNTLRPTFLAGKPAIRGTCLSVEFILNLLAHGATEAEILSEYEGLVSEDVTAWLLSASKSLKNTALMTSSYLEQRAARGERTRFEQALAKVGSAPAEEHDRL